MMVVEADQGKDKQYFRHRVVVEFQFCELLMDH